MKAFKVVIGLLMASLVLPVGISRAEAATYLGEFCWEDVAQYGKTFRLGVTDMGGGHYLVQGRMTVGSTVRVLHGNAELVGQNFVVTINYSGQDQDALESLAGTARLVINSMTLNGQAEVWEVVHVNSDPNPNSASVRYEGQIGYTYTACQ